MGKSLRFSGYEIAYTFIGFGTLTIFLSTVAAALTIVFKSKVSLIPELWKHLKESRIGFFATILHHVVLFLLLQHNSWTFLCFYANSTGRAFRSDFHLAYRSNITDAGFPGLGQSFCRIPWFCDCAGCPQSSRDSGVLSVAY
ncbi:uncharacterized protein [Pocillopora verrucosa]|uniref:uncharacterized protein isoform X2 n=1 Tax=Pocillopora verrucosa TaxID=203993 RepID=UPI00333E218D